MAGIVGIDSLASSRRGKEQAPQAVGAKRKAVKHTVPNTVTAQMRSMILSEIRGGRSAVQVGKAYSVAVDVVLELMIRSLEQQIRGRLAA